MSLIKKRNGTLVDFDFGKLHLRIEREAGTLKCDAALIVKVVTAEGATSSSALDEKAAEVAMGLSNTHPDYEVLAARLFLSNIYKSTLPGFLACMEELCNNGLVPSNLVSLVRDNLDLFSVTISTAHDKYLTYPELDRLVLSHLKRVNGAVAERPQFFFMRRAIEVGGLAGAVELYRLFSSGHLSHDLHVRYFIAVDDSIDGIFGALSSAALNSRLGEHILLDVTRVRAKGSYVASTNGQSNGVTPMLRAFDATASYIGGGGFTASVDLSHADLEDFLELKKPNGKDEARARHLSYIVSVPSLFMERAQGDASWSLFCPKEAPGLAQLKGAEFAELYKSYESTPGLARKVLRAQEVLLLLLGALSDGLISVVFKDINPTPQSKSEYCTLDASKFVQGRGVFEFDSLRRTVQAVTRTISPHIFVGFSGFSDALQLMGLAFESPEAARFNRDLWEAVALAGGNISASETQDPHFSLVSDGLIHQPLVHEMLQRGLWNNAVSEAISSLGSVQGVKAVPDDLQAVFKVASEVKQKVLVDMCAARSALSPNFSGPVDIYLQSKESGKAASALFYAWRSGCVGQISFKFQ